MNYPFRYLTIRLILLNLLLLISDDASAQQPASFLLGEDQFRGIQIYDVIQDKSLNYWFATNEGLFCFNGVVYEQVVCKKAKSSSVFNFVMDPFGTIYCTNLNNQVFRIRNKQCTLFYELTEDEGSADISLAVDPYGNVLVSSRKIIILDPKGGVLKRERNYGHYIGPPLTTAGGTVLYHLSHSDSVLTYSQGQFELKRLKLSGKRFKNASGGVLRCFHTGNDYFALDLKTKVFYSFDPNTFNLTPQPDCPLFKRSEYVRVYENTNGFWIASTLPGISYFDKKITCTENIFFDNYFISDVFEDVEGNILLSTFDKGILVVSDLKTPDVIYQFTDDPVMSIYSEPASGLILGTSKGKLMCYANGELIELRTSGKRPIEVIDGFPGAKQWVFDDGHIRIYNYEKRTTTDLIEASLKDVAFVSENLFYLGTNQGVIRVTPEKGGGYRCEQLPQLNNRIHFIEYDPIHRLVYVSTTTGLIVFGRSGKTKHLKYQGEELYPNGIQTDNGSVYVSSKEDGILVFRNGRFVRKIVPRINNKTTIIKKLIVYRNTIIATTSNGFFQFDLNGKLLRSISSTYGFSRNRVVDFTFHKGKLWVSHAGGVQQIDPDYHAPNHIIPFVRIDKILVNDKEVMLQSGRVFAPNQRKFQFFFSSSSLRNRETIKYHYRLLGSDRHWSTADYNTRQVSYNSLAPGKYVMQIRIENQGDFSEIRSLTFTVLSPWYTRWWFILLIAVFLIDTIVYSYHWQLAIQRKKAERINELNASKLTAIQSQMNPHFIFNSLNSIQDLILKGDVEHSYSYITTFSDLVRRTLNYSDKDFINFEQELKLLELYLSLEKLRFKKEFDYTIDTDQIDEDVMIPPLLIQPFIENALVHGLLHKKGEKRLRITFILEDLLICSIEDNGIGREAAKNIRQRQRSDHESFSGKAINRRFEILNTIFEGRFGCVYEDLYENGIASGTRVTLHIPIKQQF